MQKSIATLISGRNWGEDGEKTIMQLIDVE